MNTPTNHQIITAADGTPAFVVVPYADYIRQYPQQTDTLPNDVVQRLVIDGIPPVRAWREHLGLTQTEVADRAGLQQPALARIERGDTRPRKATLQKIATAMGLSLQQLDI